MADKMKRNMQDITKTKQILMAMAVVLLLSLLFLPVSYGAANVAAQAQSQQQAAGDQNAHDEAEGYTTVLDLADTRNWTRSSIVISGKTAYIGGAGSGRVYKVDLTLGLRKVAYDYLT